MVLGLLLGSFLNVVIYRLPLAESETSDWWVGYRSLVDPPRSKCPRCGHEIRWYENIPVVSWVALRGRCSACQTPISPRYVLVELLTGVLFLACWVRFGFTYALLPAVALVLFVIPLVFIDAQHWILPFELTLPGIALGIALALPLGFAAVVQASVGAVAGFVLFRAMEYVGWLLFEKEALGAGDKFLLALLGGFLGWRSLFGILFLSSLQGAVFGVVNLALRGRAGPSVDVDGASLGAENSDDVQEEPPLTFTPAFLKKGLSFPQRMWAIVYALFLQPIPDDPEPSSDEEAVPQEWQPGTTSLPFGPWLGLAGLEVLLLTPWIQATFAGTPLGLATRLLFGQPN
jgi:leader peptidase (prepilin peptidase)/N-methyltransferase